MCGGYLGIGANQITAVCEYCGTMQTLPKLDDDRIANLCDRANHFSRNSESIKACGSELKRFVTVMEDLLNPVI